MRYPRLLAMQFKSSLLLAMQYRLDFVLEGFVEAFWMVTVLLPLYAVFHLRSSIAGWSFGEALVVMGFFTFLEGVLEGAINPSLLTVVDHIRRGSFDFVLLKPADAQFLVSTARFRPWSGVNVLTSLAIFVWAFHVLGRSPSIAEMAASAVAAGCAIAILYSLWMFTVCAAFYVVKIDNLTQLFSAVFDAARWPSTVFKGVLRMVFTFVIPLALMTTVPAQALLGTLAPWTLAGTICGSALALVLSRFAWKTAIARYTSAGG